MIGFRKIYGANWLKQVHTNTIVEDGKIRVEPLGKLPVHWNYVRNILLNRY